MAPLEYQELGLLATAILVNGDEFIVDLPRQKNSAGFYTSVIIIITFNVYCLVLLWKLIALYSHMLNADVLHVSLLTGVSLSQVDDHHNHNHHH